MGVLDRVVVVVMLGSLLASAGMVGWAIIRLRRLPGDPMNRFKYGWLGAFALMVGLSCSLGLSAILVQVAPTALTMASALVINVLSQPIAVLCSWMGVRKFVRGLFGMGDYAGSRVAGLSAGWIVYSTLNGVGFLVFGAVLGLVSAWPIFRWSSH